MIAALARWWHRRTCPACSGELERSWTEQRIHPRRRIVDGELSRWHRISRALREVAR